jgi:hypothetical protein
MRVTGRTARDPEVSSSPPPFQEEKPATPVLAPANDLVLTCASQDGDREA